MVLDLAVLYLTIIWDGMAVVCIASVLGIGILVALILFGKHPGGIELCINTT